MKKKIRVGIDVDNVIVDFSEKFIYEFNRITEKNAVREDITEWDIELLFNEIYKDIDKTLIRKILLSPEMVEDIPYKEFSKEILLEIGKNKSIEIVIITALHDELIENRKAWFKKEFPELNYELHFEKIKSNVHLNNPIDYMIDDGLHNLEDLSKYIPRENCICIDEPYNKNSEYVTVKNLKEAYQYILQKENL